MIKKNPQAIVVFTKDRPSTVEKTLAVLSKVNFTIVVLDDSFLIENRRQVKSLVENYSNVIYHGYAEQKKFLLQKRVKRADSETFFNRLGVRSWNLGYARNYALFYLKMNQYDKGLFLDDDLVVSKSYVTKTFKLLEKYDFVGGRVVGMIDDSVIGFVVRELNYPIEEYYSGGCVAFNLDSVNEFFINQYNEDWIWLYLHNLKRSFCKYGMVKQLYYDKYFKAKSKIQKQELGEVLVDGVKECYSAKSFRFLKNKSFWNRILKEKDEYYRELKELTIAKGRKDLLKMISHASDCAKQLNASELIHIFKLYYRNQRRWVDLITIKNERN